MGKDADAYRTISEVAEALDIPPHVLRFWETKFPQIKPLKRGGGRRYYRRADIDLLRAIRGLLYGDGYTIRGVQRLLKVQGPAAVAALRPGHAPPQPEADGDEPPGEVGAAATAVTDGLPTQALVEKVAAEIAACRALVAEAFGAGPAGPDA